MCPEVALDGFRHEQLEETAKIKRLQRARRVAISHAYSHALKTFQVLSLPSMRLLYSVDHLCKARRAVARCARTHRLKEARTIVHFLAYPQARKTFQVINPPLMLPEKSENQLNGAQRAVTRCARTHRPGTVATSPYSQALKTFQAFNPPSRRLLCSPDVLCKALRAVTRCARTHRLTQARRVAISPPTRKPGRPFRSLALPSCFQMDLNFFLGFCVQGCQISAPLIDMSASLLHD